MRATKKLLDDIEAGRADLVSLVYSDLELYCQLCLKIATKAATVIPFVFNDAQRVLHDRCQELLKTDGMVRLVLLKARQYGGSTYIGGRIFKRTATDFNQHAKILAQNDEHALKLLKMYSMFYERLPPALRPATRFQSKSELFFAKPPGDPEGGLNSSLGVYSAGSKSAGRSATLRHLHCSEVAFWPGDVSDLMLGLLNTVPQSGDAAKGTEVFLESTANGVGGYFHSMYARARASRDEGGFRACFIPWYLHQEYRAKPPVNFEKALTRDERALHGKDHPGWEYANPANGKKNLTLDQLFWRRICIRTVCDGDEKRFRQEYPVTDEEAFVTSGGSYFPMDKLADRLRKVGELKYAFRGEIEEEEVKNEGPEKKKLKRRGKWRPKLLEDDLNGRLTIWEQPQKEARYVIFADTSEGAQGGDPSVIEVVNRATGFQAAEWVGLIDPDALADVFYVLGQHYNWAHGSPEAQNHGLRTLATLKERAYPGLYQRQVYDETKRIFVDREGWMTTSKTRPLMLATLKRDFRDGELIVNSVRLLSEMQTFQLIRDKLQAQDGCYDDCVMAVAGACQMREELPVARKRRTKSWLDNPDDPEVESRQKRWKAARKNHKPQYDRYTGALLN